MLDSLGNLQRSHYAGALRATDDGRGVVLMGWVARRRDLGNLIFIDLRDRAGIAQIVFNKDTSPEAHAKAEQLRSEYVVAVEGRVVRRAKANPDLATGEVEVVATRLHILNTAKTPPFTIEEETTAAEDTRLRYRYLDLRRPRSARNIALRHRVIFEIRKAMDEMGFYEIETPMLTRSTPEGARDYLVPSRVHPGQFYALPQSPQIFKQILMISGMDRYFQIARCFRDEDQRADRQPEFTQLDLEMSFPTQDAIFGVIERVMQRACETATRHLGPAEASHIRLPVNFKFLRLPYQEAMRRFGTDKPDLRYEAEIVSLDSILPANLGSQIGISPPFVGFHFSQQNLRITQPLSKTAIKNLVQTVVEQAASSIDEVKARSRTLGREVLLIDWCLVSAESKLLKNADLAQAFARLVNAKMNDVLFLGALRGTSEHCDPFTIHKTFDILRNRLKNFTKEYDPKNWRFVWITDFPLFEWSETENRWAPAQHPFTGIFEEDLDKLEDESRRGEIRSKGYDLVLNGVELGSGSVRIHRQDVQSRVFRALGLTDEQAHQRFGFFLDALSFGTPPHGGIALGLDRVVALLAGEKSIREVIAFPKTTAAQDLMANSPSAVETAQLDELGIATKAPGNRAVKEGSSQ